MQVRQQKPNSLMKQFDRGKSSANVLILKQCAFQDDVSQRLLVMCACLCQINENNPWGMNQWQN